MNPTRRAAGILALALAGAFVLSQVLGGPLGYVIVSGRSMEPVLHTGDLALVVRQGSYRRGDVIAFRVPQGEPAAGNVIIHRVIGGSPRDGYVTQGDNRDGRDPWRPVSADVIGEMAIHVPKLGLIPAFLASPIGLALAAALVCFLLVVRTGSPKQEDDVAPPDAAHAPALQLPTAPDPPATGAAPAPHKLRPVMLTAVAVAVAGAGAGFLAVRGARRR